LPPDEELEKRHEFSPEFEQAMEDMMDKYFPQKPDDD